MEAHAIVLNVLGVLLQAALSMFGQPGAMPDVRVVFATFISGTLLIYLPIEPRYRPSFLHIP